MENFGDWQKAFYTKGVTNDTSPYPFSFAELQTRAERVMNPLIFGYVRGGAGDETTQDRNVSGLRAYGLTPRVLRDRTTRDLSTELLDRRLQMPIFICPVGVLGAVHPDGDLEIARMCAELGIAGMYSTLSEATIEEIAAARGESLGIFQLYPAQDRELTDSFVRRAEAAGFDAIAVTLDAGSLGYRPRDLSHGFIPMMRGKCIANYTSDSRFLEIAGVTSKDDLDPLHAGQVWSTLFSDPNFTWANIAHIRKLTTLPLVLKGVCDPEDARRARDEGVDVIACSNHGGRQANGGIPAIEHLPGVLKAADGLPVTFDSGVRDGVDVLRALALGATAVGIGRPYVYGLAIGGRDGAAHVVRALLAEADLTMAIDCYASLSELSVSRLPPAPW
ncbi:MAG: alpha-hydroxy-acid oxidizing protein [Actinomycetia bacterium]|nr:alpha-hydroxy-acid oxidizing protein [Actinomycetes bacterium]MCH9702680.1 alpha-hydroxy-acid oxidizing protein [Actinomycetes bacterium]MCH9760729.1 alpha-hydroxy-acid oxidizing protein [Actinomycetes bacterium]